MVEECKRWCFAFRTISQGSESIDKGYKVKNLIQGILEDVQLLTREHGMKMADTTQQEQISDAVTEVGALSTFSPEHTTQQTRLTAYQSGSGTQNNAQGENIAQEEARQYNSNGGTMNIGRD